MISMIDEYSANLEQIVEKRTEEIEELKEKTERLLYQIMPKYNLFPNFDVNE